MATTSWNKKEDENGRLAVSWDGGGGSGERSLSLVKRGGTYIACFDAAFGHSFTRLVWMGGLLFVVVSVMLITKTL